jgi:hypothetical protein
MKKKKNHSTVQQVNKKEEPPLRLRLVSRSKVLLPQLSGLDKLCDKAYDDEAPKEVVVPFIDENNDKLELTATLAVLPDGVTELPHLRLYTSIVDGQGYSVFVSRGTHVREDVLTDLQLAGFSGTVPERFIESAEHVKLCTTLLNNTRVIFTGHSLGAAEAEYLAVCFDCESVVFDNPGCGFIIQQSLKHREVDKKKHLTINGPPNLVNRAATWFTGGPVGQTLHGNNWLFVVTDILLVILIFLLVVLWLQSSSMATNVALVFLIAITFAIICWFTFENHSLGNRSRIAYYTENAPAGGHLVSSVAIVFLALIWLIAEGGYAVYKKLFKK